MEFYHSIWKSVLLFTIRPHWEHLILLVALLRTIDRASATIRCFLNTVRDEGGIFSRIPRQRLRILLCLLLVVIISTSSLPVLFIYRSVSGAMLLLSTSLFLILMDEEALFNKLKLAMESLSITTAPKSLWAFIQNGVLQDNLQFTHAKTFGFHVEHAINSMLKVCVLGVGSTSGHPYLESLCLVTMSQHIAYSVATFLLIPSSAFLIKMAFEPVCAWKSVPKFHTPRYAFRTVGRWRSSSCSIEESTYPERRHVDVRQLVQHLEALHAVSPAQQRIKYVTACGLFVLYLHNRYLLWIPKSANHCELGSADTVQTDGIAIANETLESSYWSNAAILDHTNFNLLFFLLIGILLYYRAKLYGLQRAKLLNLDLTPPVKNTWQVLQSPDISSNIFSKANGSAHALSNECADSPTTPRTSTKFVPNDGNTVNHGTNFAEAKVPEKKLVRPCGVQLRPKESATMKFSASDADLLHLLSSGELKTRELESLVGNPVRAVELRRLDLARLLSSPYVLERLPYKEYDYRYVHGQCCEEVIGYVPIPVGKVGPLLLDGHSHYVPLATTEGCLVASTNRGCRALFLAGGVKSVLYRDQMTRAPVVWFASIHEVVECIAWIESAEGFGTLKNVFEQTSAHIQLLSIFPNPCGHYLHIRFAARTGEAMGMNMVSKATNFALNELHCHFPTMQVISLSGNMCTDKKPAAINSILGRGKSVIAEAQLPATILAQVLHTTGPRLVRLAHAKNWTGSAMAGCPGMMGSNAHAANIVAGIFAATGQDLAQVVDASACLTQFEVDDNNSLVASVTMPCVEVGTIGGGTRLPAQRSCLDMLDLNVDRSTEHLARIIAGTVLAGELSLMAALDTDDLVTAHLRLNRARTTTTPIKSPVPDAESVGDSESGAIVSYGCGRGGGSSWSNTAIPVPVKSDSSNGLESSHPTM